MSSTEDNKANETQTIIEDKIKKLSVPIIESVTKEQIDNFKFFNERAYTNYYFLSYNEQQQSDDLCIRVHSNKLMLITFAEGNDIFKSEKNIEEIDFVVKNADRSKIKIQGKRKHGAKQVHPETIICKIKLDGETEMRNVRAGITGYLIEINNLIMKNPNLLKTSPKNNGFLAIVMPKGPIQDSNILNHNHHLIDEEKYFELLKKNKKSDFT